MILGKTAFDILTKNKFSLKDYEKIDQHSFYNSKDYLELFLVN